MAFPVSQALSLVSSLGATSTRGFRATHPHTSGMRHMFAALDLVSDVSQSDIGLTETSRAKRLNGSFRPPEDPPTATAR
jgi:hypothetical protein